MEQKRVEKLSWKLKLFWPLFGISTSVAGVVTGYISYYASDYMGISVALVGTLIMISKIFDGFTDVMAGYLIDRTHTKYGKGRPYDFSLIGYWLSIIALYCAPRMSVVLSAAYLFIMYTLINSVFATLMNCGGAVYMANALDDPRQSVSLISITSTLGTLCTMVASIILPQMLDKLGNTSAAWKTIALSFGIPMMILGMLRFFMVKEKRNSDVKNERIGFKEMLQVLAKNKYILLVALINCWCSIGCNLNINTSTYYCVYIMKNIGLQSIISLSMVSVILIVILMPFLSKKFGTVNVMRVCSLFGAFGYILRLFDLNSVPLLVASSFISMVGFYTFFSFSSAMVIDCMDYGEWKTGKRSEGAVAATQSVCSKVGAAIGVGLCGFLMGMAGYNGNLDVQTAGTNAMIIALSSWIPAAFCIVEFIMLKFYKLEENLPQIRLELNDRRNIK